MSRKDQAVQNVVTAVEIATQVINDYGKTSPEAAGAMTGAINAVNTARAHGATDNDIRNARPQ